MLLSMTAAAWVATAIVQPAQTVSAAPYSVASQGVVVSALQSLIDAINGDSGQRKTFASDGFSSRALQKESGAARLSWLNRIAADSGGLTIHSIVPQGDQMVEAVVKTRNGGKFGKLVLFTSGQEPGKVADLFLLSARDPALRAAEAWPTERLTDRQIADAIDKRASVLEREGSFSGTLLVARGDAALLRKAYGLADRQKDVPNRIDTALHSGSVGKMFTAAAILKLAQDGRLSLDDPIARFVPQYPHAQSSGVTVRQLLSHQGGLGEWDGRAFKAQMSGAEAAATMTSPPAAPAGKRFQYSNAGFVLLGAAIETITALPLEKALEELVFRPAGMIRTSLAPVSAAVPNKAFGYFWPVTDPFRLGSSVLNTQQLGYAGDGSGGAYTTVDDLFAFDRALLNGRLLRSEQTALMLTPISDFPGSARPARYGFGAVFDDCGGRPAVGHDGGGPNSGVNAVNRATLDGEWTIIALNNYDPPAADELVASICEFVSER